MKAADSPQSILITGASSGIGRALARHYAQEGVFLHLIGRDQGRLSDIAEQCRGAGAQAQEYVVDVCNQSAMAECLAGIIVDRPLDLVIASAGISGGSAGFAEGEPVSQVRTIFETNFMGTINTIEPVLLSMLKRGAGQIAVMSSLAGYRGWKTAPGYSASKGAVRFYGEALRGSLAPKGVKVNVICPGFIKTAMTDVNDFPMPFLMSAEKAANIIAKGLARNQGRIAFPAPMVFGVWFLSILPDTLAQMVIRLMPDK